MNVDEQLLLDIKNGNISAFENFFQNSHNRLLNYARLFIKEDFIASDLVQEAFVHFWEKRKELRTGKSIEALIFKSVRNRCLNYLRENKTYQKHLDQYSIEETSVQHLSQYDFLGKEEDSIEEMLINEIERSIEKLPEKCRQVFVMNKYEGKKQHEIAEELGISVKAVEKHISTAKGKLKKHLELKFPALSMIALFFIEF